MFYEIAKVQGRIKTCRVSVGARIAKIIMLIHSSVDNFISF